MVTLMKTEVLPMKKALKVVREEMVVVTVVITMTMMMKYSW